MFSISTEMSLCAEMTYTLHASV